MPTTHALGEYQKQQMALGEVDTLGFKTASYFNQYFAQYVSDRPHLLEGVTTTFPLHLFDDSTFDEVLPTPIPLHAPTNQHGGDEKESQAEDARRELLLSSGERRHPITTLLRPLFHSIPRYPLTIPLTHCYGHLYEVPAICLLSSFVEGYDDSGDVDMGVGNNNNGPDSELSDVEMARQMRVRGMGTWHACKVIQMLPPPSLSTPWAAMDHGNPAVDLRYVVRLLIQPTADATGATANQSESHSGEEKGGIGETGHHAYRHEQLYTISSMHVLFLRHAHTGNSSR